MDTTIAFLRAAPAGGHEVVVNFGLHSGREATIAEVDRLARRLHAHMSEVRIHAVRTHDVGRGTEAVVHQVVVEIDAGVPELEPLRRDCETWASECAAERSLAPLGT